MTKKKKAPKFVAEETAGQPIVSVSEEERAEAGPQQVKLRPMTPAELHAFEVERGHTDGCIGGYLCSLGDSKDEDQIVIAPSVSGIGKRGYYKRRGCEGAIVMSGLMDEIYRTLLDRLYGKGRWQTDHFPIAGKGFTVLGKAPAMVLDGRGGRG